MSSCDESEYDRSAAQAWRAAEVCTRAATRDATAHLTDQGEIARAAGELVVAKLQEWRRK